MDAVLQRSPNFPLSSLYIDVHRKSEKLAKSTDLDLDLYINRQQRSLLIGYVASLSYNLQGNESMTIKCLPSYHLVLPPTSITQRVNTQVYNCKKVNNNMKGMKKPVYSSLGRSLRSGLILWSELSTQNFTYEVGYQSIDVNCTYQISIPDPKSK